ncbi:MAG: hypothetical protein U9R79_06100 [Armatimonadota bacterium]|nr:hypothetical protein [Armatimonadota bacterium]
MSRREVIAIAVVLVIAALILHTAHYLIFQDLHHVLIYGFGDIAFLPVEVLVISLVVDRVLHERERQALRHKMNMVVGTFFSALGQPLLERMCDVLDNREEVRECLAIGPDWTSEQIQQLKGTVPELRLKMRPDVSDIEALRDLLTDHRDFLLRLLQNPALLEDEDFSDLLWALTHLQEELAARGDLSDLPEPDLNHLIGDTHRVYGHLLREWLEYMSHLNEEYPFLYSFQARTNPLRPDASVTVTE